ncbi:hypothetical protein Lesp02_03880 [Lentzea sp. NBRC 105346]|uniref:hypothetical protein n=1 Tax=Lentzea sp. NBRC 105346 TaxID=3032205 RepID=UPI0024A11521|nr:hypothetical protein [Lentzea sp. NBRC 105346]GLZ28198.1 hypothetical protein Lesp02_03880 [Lentzea sp. NBRC 105346]
MPLNTNDVEARMRSLVTLIRAGNCLTVVLSTWLGMHGVERNGVRHKLIDRGTREITQHEADSLDLATGASLPYRRGELWADLAGASVRIATANALVVMHRLPFEVIQLLERIPLGVALQPYGVCRDTAPPRYSWTPDSVTGPRLVVSLTATLHVGGRPWALTDETIDQSIVDH